MSSCEDILKLSDIRRECLLGERDKVIITADDYTKARFVRS